MKKVIKIILIVIMCFIVAHAIKIAYGLWIFYNVSSEDQMKIAQASYERCISEGKEDCERFLVMGLKASLSTQRKEMIAVVLDKNKPEQERIQALKTFYLLSREKNKEISKEEVDFYDLITFDKENSIDLSKVAYEYLLEASLDDVRLTKIQVQTLKDPDASPEYKRKAIRSLGEAGVAEAADILIEVLEDEDSAPRYTASRSLIKMGAIDKIPDLLEIALDETKAIPNRTLAIETIEEMVSMYDIENKEMVIESLKILLGHEKYTVRTASASALETLTGEEYYDENKVMTEEEVDEYMSNALENILIPGIDY